MSSSLTISLDTAYSVVLIFLKDFLFHWFFCFNLLSSLYSFFMLNWTYFALFPQLNMETRLTLGKFYLSLILTFSAKFPSKLVFNYILQINKLFYFKIIIDSYTVVRNNTEIPCTLHPVSPKCNERVTGQKARGLKQRK